MHLDDDSLFLIFNKLGTADLVKLLEIPQFASAVWMVFRQRFNKVPVVIKGAFSTDSVSGEHIFKQIRVSDDAIVIEDFEEAAEILRNFGHIIKKLDILPLRGWSEEYVEQICELIKLHCSETLQSIYFHDIDEDIYNKLTVPFKAVETVGLMSRYNNTKLISSEFGFNNLFPAIQNLYMDSYNNLGSSHTDTTDYVMPNLKHIQRTDKGYDSVLDRTQFGNIIKSNPQITSIVVRSVNPESLEFLSRHAPNLEFLQFVDYFDQPGDDFTNIRFDKLKNLRLMGYIPRRFACDNLEEIFVATPASFSLLMDFITNRVNLKKFHCNGYLENDEILHLARTNLNVSEITIRFEFDVEAESIIELIRNSPNLKELQLLNNNAEKIRLGNDISALLPNLGNRWTIEIGDDRIILSKNSN